MKIISKRTEIQKAKYTNKTLKCIFTLQTKTKKGVPLYSNLINLKSNTMKNTLQIYTLLN
ncbi:MAG: hypothetical protein E7104_05285 [Prevotella sp.]|nr:hypothetical protein [Prevotella sp.]